MNADALWKLPAVDLLPADDGGWQVQPEPGLGPAQAVFAPLRRTGGQGWEVALAAGARISLTEAGDRAWTRVPLPPAPGADGYLCLLRYDHPAERACGTTFRLQLRRLADPVGDAEVTGAELQHALGHLQDSLGPALALQVVPARSHEPDPVPQTLCFAYASCQYPAGLLDRAVAHRSYGRLAAWLQDHPMPQRLLLLGDQVYADATYGLLDPVRLDDRYRVPYEELRNRETGPFASLPQEFLARRRLMPDDHEIADDWEPAPDGRADPHYVLGMQAYWLHQRRAAPQASVQLREQGPGWRLFMADSRTQRDFRSEDTLAQATILGASQTAELAQWLREAPAEELKIVTTAAMLLPRVRRDMDVPLYLDNWQGYPASFHGLLALLCELQSRNLVFLSGDAHVACSVDVEVRNLDTDARCTFSSHHAAALYAPYPFANEQPANLLLRDGFDFAVAGRSYRCTVAGAVLAGGANGCSLLHATRDGDAWRVRAEVLAG